MSNQEWVEMTHPKVGDAKGPVTRRAYEMVWKDKGWKIKGDAPTPAGAGVGTTQTEGEK